MKKMHQNLFYSYRGGNLSDKDIQEQLENNVTKAFINVLEKSSLNLQKKIIESIIPINLSQDVDKINYTLQESTIGRERINKIKNRYILGISPNGNIWEDEEKIYTKSSIPDAWIWSKDFVILIENKVQGELNKNQIEKHNETLNGELIIKSWKKDIYKSLKKIEKEQLSPKDKLLVQEFNEFLEMTGLTEFNGFEKKDLVRMHSEDRDEVDYVRTKFKKLGDAVADRLGSKGLYHKHRPKPDEWWDYFVRDMEYSYYTLAHFSIYSCDNILGLKLHLQKPSTDFTNFKKKISQNSEDFRNILLSLKKSELEYEIELKDKEHVKGYDTTAGFVYTIYSRYLDDARIGLLENLILNKSLPMRKPCFSLRREFSITEAEKLGDKLVNEILDTIDDWWDIYQYIIS